MPRLSITITAEPSGSVTAKGADDDVSATLLTHAGFQQIEDWYGRRHRLPTTTPAAERVAIATHAAEMLHAARYDVDLDHRLDATRTATPALPLGPYTAGAELLRITDQIRSAENGEDLRHAVDHLLHPEHGALERAREALEAAGEQINDLDDSVYRVADQFGVAAELVSAAQSELIEYDVALGRINSAQQARVTTRARSAPPPDSRSAALSPSPAAAKAKVSPTPGAGGAAPAVHPPQAPEPRTR
ncbi:hypothetical protein ACGH2B_25050 [Streptomyces sp. BBFR2]|uniref:hypothetical protein n=1 Tax=Streptomyces sp. BBFR2 TaxID=3372854 RepID=UPI0037DA2525